MNKYLRAISNNLIFFILSVLAFLILTPLAIHVMGDEFYGLWSILLAVCQFANIGTLGIGSIVNKFASEKDKSDREISAIISSAVLIIAPMALITVVILLSINSTIVKNINPSALYKEQFKTALLISTFGIFPQFFTKIFQGYFLSQIQNKLVRSIDFFNSVFPLIGGVFISLYFKNFIWLSIFNLIIQISSLSILIYEIQKRLQWQWSPQKETVLKMTRFSSYLFIESTAIAIFQQLDKIIVGFVLGPILAGVYAVGTSVGLRMSIVVGQITEVMVPYASRKTSAGENGALLLTFRTLSKYINILVALMGSFCIIWMNEILSIWISADYAYRYSKLFSLLILAYGLLSLSRPAHQTLQGMGHVRQTSSIYLLSSILMLVGVYLFSRVFGIVGAAAANMIMTLLLSMNIYIYKSIIKKIDLKILLSDLKWGLLFPISSYVLILLTPSLAIKGLASGIIALWFFMMILEDNIAMSYLRQFSLKFKRIE